MKIAFFDVKSLVGVGATSASHQPDLAVQGGNKPTDGYKGGGLSKASKGSTKEGLGLMSILGSKSSPSLAIAKSAKRKLHKLSEQYRELCHNVPSWGDEKSRQKTCEWSRKKTAVVEEIFDTFRSWCMHANWSDPEVEKEISAFSPGFLLTIDTESIAQLRDENPEQYLRILLRHGRRDAHDFDWGVGFFKADNPETLLNRLLGIIPHQDALERRGLWRGASPFVGLCTTLMSEPSAHERLLRVAPVFYSSLTQSPELVTKLIESAVTPSAKAFLNLLLADYFTTEPPTPKNIATCRERMEALEQKIHRRLPMQAMALELQQATIASVEPVSLGSLEQALNAIGMRDSADSAELLVHLEALIQWTKTATAADVQTALKAALSKPWGSHQRVCNSELNAVYQSRVQDLQDAMVARLRSLNALDTTVAGGILDSLPEFHWLRTETLATVVSAGSPDYLLMRLSSRYRATTDHDDVANVALVACRDSQNLKSFDAWDKVLKAITSQGNLPVEPQLLGEATTTLMRFADPGKAKDRELVASWFTHTRAPFPQNAWIDYASACLNTGTLEGLDILLVSAKNAGILAKALVTTERVTDRQRLAFSTFIEESWRATKRDPSALRKSFIRPAFAKILANLDSKAVIPEAVKKLHRLLGKDSQYRIPVPFVRQLDGMPAHLETGDESKDLYACFDALKKEETRFPAAARLRELLLSQTDPDEAATRFLIVCQRLEQAIGYMGWLGSSKRQQAELDAQQIMREVMEPGFSHVAKLCDTQDAQKLDVLIQRSEQFKNRGQLFRIPDDVLAKISAETLTRDGAMRLLEQPSEIAQSLGVARLELELDSLADFKDRAKMVAGVVQRTGAPMLVPPPEVEPGTAWMALLDQSLGWLTGPGPSLRRRITDQLLAQTNAQWETAENDAGRLEVLRLLSSMPRTRDINQAVERYLSADWISSELLTAALPLHQDLPQALPEEWLLTTALTHFPGDGLCLVDYLCGRIDSAKMCEELGVLADDPTVVALERLRGLWQTRSAHAQRTLLAGVLTKILSGTQKLPDGRSAHEFFKELIDQHVQGRLAEDADLGPWAESFGAVLSRLSADKRGRLLAELVLTPPGDAVDLMQVLIRHGGILAVKAGQQLSEDPDVPERIRNPLKSFLEDNQPLTVLEIWKRIPPAEQKNIAAIGPKLGTGSAKQTFLVKTRPGSMAADWITQGEPLVGAVTLPDALPDLIDLAKAATAVPELAYLLRQIQPVIERELNLVTESEAFLRVAQTRTGRSSTIRSLRVAAATESFLLREGFDGSTLHSLLKKGALSQSAKARLVSLHKTLIQDAFDTRGLPEGAETFVFTDPHLANIADNGKVAYVFDPGQYATLKQNEAQLFLRMLVAFGNEGLKVSMREDLLESLTPLCNIDRQHQGQDPAKTVAQRLDEAYAVAERVADDSVGYRLQVFFNACSKQGLDIPRGFFAAAKMMHIIQGQCRDLGLGDHMAETVRDLFVDQLGPWGKLTAWWDSSTNTPRSKSN